jgi:phospholipid/cholesterol/gamma-HCH transport system substrate-binding protein
MNRLPRDTILGSVFFGTVGFLLWATMNLTDAALGDHPPLEVYFEDAGGIRLGDPVQLLGKRIGKVTEIDYVPDRSEQRMRLVLRVSQNPDLRQDKTIEIQDAGLIAGKQIYINPGQGAPLAQGAVLIGSTRGNPLEAAGEFFDGNGPSGKELLGLLQDARQFMQNLNNENSTVGALVTRRELYDELLGSVQTLRTVVEDVQTGKGFLGRVINDTGLRDDALRIVTNLANVSDQLNGLDSTIGRLLNDRDMATHLAEIVANFSAIADSMRNGQGVVGRLIQDEELANRLDEAVSHLSSILTKADNPQAGALGAILGDETMRQDLQRIAANLASVSAKLNDNKGLLGVLINDEDMGIRLRRILSQVSRALEDAREAAPISNFVEVLFSAF